ncbi:MAG: dockerin type I domain-containing protein, partial [Clostridiales bacterium]|nr:dockerin type I domain-containing protein [Clostridiales bacterium]
TEYSYRAVLSSVQQSAYDTILSRISIDSIDKDEQIIFDFYVSGELTDTDSIAGVAWAVFRDNPDLYWFNTTSIRAGASYNSARNVTMLRYIFYTLGTKSEAEEFISVISPIEESVVSVCSAFTYDYSKVKYIHDVICDAADYDDETSEYYSETGSILSGNPFSPVGVFIDGSAVCQGYALAFKLLCDDVGIDCIYQSGTTASGVSHAWNFVEMEDGCWYCIDSTWDGQTSSTVYTYFLLGTTNFDTRHKYTNSIGVPLSSADYTFSGTEETTAEPATAAETTTESTTETTETAAETTTRAYDGVVGDIDGSGVLTANDAACLIAYVLNNDVVNSSWDLSLDTADVNKDGERTAADAAQILAKVLNSAYEYSELTEEMS